MSRATFFIRSCPTCGRRLQIRVEYLGRIVRCRHCDGHFEAQETSSQAATADSGTELLERANELLASMDAARLRPR